MSITILGIESSCDDTSSSVIRERRDAVQRNSQSSRS